MTKKIHPTAIIAEGSKIANDVEIGAYCVIGADVEIGSGTILKSHIVIDGITKIGKNNIIFPFACLGSNPQDLKFKGEASRTIIGDNNRIREYVTIHPGTETGRMLTEVGSNCLLMVGVHIAHDCVVGDNVIMANNVTLAGHVQVGDFAVIGGLSAVHQFVRIGQHAMIGGMSGVENDVIPYATVMGERAWLAGLNLIGLKRRNFEKDEINALRAFYKKLFDDNGNNLQERLHSLIPEYQGKDMIKNVIDFIQGDKSRAICRPKSQISE